MLGIVSGWSKHHFHGIKDCFIIRCKKNDIRRTGENRNEIRIHRDDRGKISKFRRTRKELSDGLSPRTGGQYEDSSESKFEVRHVGQRKQSGYRS